MLNKGIRLNVGCGQTPTPGWLNIDNSLSVWLAKHRLIARIAKIARLVGEDQIKFIKVAREHGIVWGSALRLPVADESAEVIYSSHMLEHLDREEAVRFIHECYRALRPGGILRLVLPDLKKLVDDYLASGDADKFIESTYLTRPRLKSWREKFMYLIVGDRHHLWMYDEKSLSRLLRQCGFKHVWHLEPGITKIPEPGELNLREREGESLYMEAQK
jgi:predicted SAM-dependent methyltransferase